ncbi:autoinducer synthase [Mesobaculum littorinae]|uniref:Acyl-homoserine-lactone synthase n=1 Tax=Mesobaculum littorinae TaxID=2486419 RepID=A0A438AD75_9RHOB|nr:acyl-homoserine-lactone synthase [Mesobaculum littorinae]RVV96650.1 autoinducer synthase [Mesobaculum littorinae]
MIRYLYGSALARHPALRDGMFRDRAGQFCDRLGWPLDRDAAGREIDAYDTDAALYVMVVGPHGCHRGSMRFLPTTGRTMLADHFAHLCPEGAPRAPGVWECTRFCLAPGATGTGGARISAALMLGALEMGLQLGLTGSVGVFDARMLRVYRRLGWPPVVLGEDGAGKDGIAAGRWAFTPALRPVLRRVAGISPELAAWCLRRGFGEGRLALAA